MRQKLLGLDLDKDAHTMSYHTVFRLFNQVKRDAKFFQAIIWFPGLPWKLEMVLSDQLSIARR